MDFQKAFDTVPHRRLIQKVSAHGIEGRLLGWLRDFLADREQRVVVNGTRSSTAKVTSGVPQGSVLGPVLFLLFINDLPKGISNSIKMFADDTKLFSMPSAVDDDSLQTDLDLLQDWSTKWLMHFHPEKCKVMKLGRQRSAVQYHMNNVVLEEIEAEKDLGVLIDNQLSFKSQVATITAKANKVVGIIRRSFDNLTEELFVTLFKSLVRPILTYLGLLRSTWRPSLSGLFGSLCQQNFCPRIECVTRLGWGALLEENNTASNDKQASSRSTKRGDPVGSYPDNGLGALL